MASMCCQPITHSSAHRSIFDLDFQFSKPPTSPDASRLGSAARFNLSEMDVRPSMDERQNRYSTALHPFWEFAVRTAKSVGACVVVAYANDAYLRDGYRYLQ